MGRIQHSFSSHSRWGHLWVRPGDTRHHCHSHPTLRRHRGPTTQVTLGTTRGPDTDSILAILIPGSCRVTQLPQVPTMMSWLCRAHCPAQEAAASRWNRNSNQTMPWSAQEPVLMLALEDSGCVSHLQAPVSAGKDDDVGCLSACGGTMLGTGHRCPECFATYTWLEAQSPGWLGLHSLTPWK